MVTELRVPSGDRPRNRVMKTQCAENSAEEGQSLGEARGGSAPLSEAGRRLGRVSQRK